jgi:glucose-1-phosphate adenylyltransferase
MDPTASSMNSFDTAAYLSRETLGIIMGGGAGSRLFPLTKDRSKPAVPLGGKYRIVDIPISNCINSGIHQVYVLTQYNSASLNRHINRAYKFDAFDRGFVEILAAQQTPKGNEWYQGTADAVRQNIKTFLGGSWQFFMILSGDQLYSMDFRQVLKQHISTEADITIATLPVEEEAAKSFGILQSDAQGRIHEFVEKPQEAEVLQRLRMGPESIQRLGLPEGSVRYQASMGIYCFNREALAEALDNDFKDFGKDIIPISIKKHRVHCFDFQGYWEDIGTIGSFFEANLDLCDVVPKYDFFDSLAPIYTNARFLPATKINGAHISRALLADGCILSDAHIERCVIGLRSIVESGTTLRDCVIMGADYYPGAAHRNTDRPPPGIGRNCRIERAIIDKNVHIGDNVVITPNGKNSDYSSPYCYIRDGIVVVPKDMVIPAGTWV